MLIVPRCAACILDDLEGATRLLIGDEELGYRIMAEALAFLSRDFGRRKMPSYYITGVHRILKRLSGLETPFRELRRSANEVGLNIAQSLSLPEDDFERFALLVRWAIAANHLDFRTVGTGYGLTVQAMTEILAVKVEEGLQIDHTAGIWAAVKGAAGVLYVLDNVGEIAFDKLLIQEMGRYTDVVAAIRGGPITSDAVMEDAVQVGLDRTVPLIVAGPDTLGISLEEMFDDLREALKTADLVVTKGQANFYVMEEYQKARLGGESQKIACLFSTKCDPIAAKFHLKGKVNIAALL
ncbi:MAG: DUF89 domain-containing protein [Anaerolineae bacterium]